MFSRGLVTLGLLPDVNQGLIRGDEEDRLGEKSSVLTMHTIPKAESLFSITQHKTCVSVKSQRVELKA